MYDDGESARAELEGQLGLLASIIGRFDAAQERRAAVLGKYTVTDQPLKKTWTSNWKLVAAVVLIVFISFAGQTVAEDKVWALHFVYATLALAGLEVIAAVVLMVRGGMLRGFAAWFLADAALILGSVFGILPLRGPSAAGGGLGAALALLAFIVMKMRDAFVPQRNERIMQGNRDARDSLERAVTAELAPIDQEIAQARRDFFDSGFEAWFPERYMDYDSVSSLWQIVRDHRAYTLKEALNILEQDRHNQQMRDLAAEQAAEQRRTTRAVDFASAMNAAMQAYQGSRTRSTIQDEAEKTRYTIRHPWEP